MTTGTIVQQMQCIVAIFKDECEAGSWAAYLDGISALWTVTADQGLGRSIEKAVGLGIDPAVVIVSARLYPTEDPELIARIRNFFPQAELLLLSSSEDAYPSLLQLSADAVRHLQVPPTGDQNGKGYFGCVLAKLVAGRPVTIGDRLDSSTGVSSVEVHCSSDKDRLLEAVDAAIVGDGDDVELFRQRAALLADELLENALYGAPKDAAGEKLFTKGAERVMLPGERLVFSFGFDGDTLAMEMTDNWGSLDADLVVDYLARNQARQACNEDLGGRGLFLIWRFFDHFHVSVHPGVKTVVGGELALSRKLDPEAPRGFHIHELRKGDAA